MRGDASRMLIRASETRFAGFIICVQILASSRPTLLRMISSQDWIDHANSAEPKEYKEKLQEFQSHVNDAVLFQKFDKICELFAPSMSLLRFHDASRASLGESFQKYLSCVQKMRQVKTDAFLDEARLELVIKIFQWRYGLYQPKDIFEAAYLLNPKNFHEVTKDDEKWNKCLPSLERILQRMLKAKYANPEGIQLD